MVRPRGIALARQGLGDALGRRPAGAVDNPALILALPYPGNDLVGGLFLREHLVGEVRAVERRDENGGVAQLQVLDDVGAHALGGGRRERHHGNVREEVPQF